MRSLIFFGLFVAVVGHAYGQSWICDSPLMTDKVVVGAWSETTLPFAQCVNTSCAVQGDTLLMRVYKPTSLLSGDPLPAKLPFLLLLSGGGFLRGDHDLKQWPEAFARRGFLVATIDYRVGWDVNGDGLVNAQDDSDDDDIDPSDCVGDFNTFLRAVIRSANDADKAVRYILGNPALYPIDTALMYTGGPSAGGSLGLMMGLSTEAERLALWDQLVMGSVPLIHNPCDMSVDPIPCLAMLNGTDTVPWYDGNYRFRGVVNCWGQYLLDLNSDAIQTAHGDVAIINFYGALDRVDPPYIGAGYDCAGGAPGMGSIRIHEIQIAHGNCSQLFDDPDAVHKAVFLDGTETSTPLEASILRNDRSLFVAKRACCFFKSAICGTPCSYPQAFVLDELKDWEQAWYNVQGRDRGEPRGCQADGTLTFGPILPDGAFQNGDLWISPNPSNGPVQIAWETDNPKATVTVRDSQGRIVFQKKVSNNDFALDSSVLEDGIYIVEAVDYGLRYTGRLMVMH
ncbi:MAG: T9SS type A sorting domain-containing protein [Flavobacteriales bacterium]